jgi:hypothetical protein
LPQAPTTSSRGIQAVSNRLTPIYDIADAPVGERKRYLGGNSTHRGCRKATTEQRPIR